MDFEGFFVSIEQPLHTLSICMQTDCSDCEKIEHHLQFSSEEFAMKNRSK